MAVNFARLPELLRRKADRQFVGGGRRKELLATALSPRNNIVHPEMI